LNCALERSKAFVALIASITDAFSPVFRLRVVVDTKAAEAADFDTPALYRTRGYGLENGVDRDLGVGRLNPPRRSSHNKA